MDEDLAAAIAASIATYEEEKAHCEEIASVLEATRLIAEEMNSVAVSPPEAAPQHVWVPEIVERPQVVAEQAFDEGALDRIIAARMGESKYELDHKHSGALVVCPWCDETFELSSAKDVHVGHHGQWMVGGVLTSLPPKPSGYWFNNSKVRGGCGGQYVCVDGVTSRVV